MNQPTTFGAFLRESRREPSDPDHVSQRELSRRLAEHGIQLDNTMISRIESGDQRRVSAAFVSAVARIFGWDDEHTRHALRLAEEAVTGRSDDDSLDPAA